MSQDLNDQSESYKRSIPDIVGVITIPQRRNKFDMFSRLEKSQPGWEIQGIARAYRAL